MSERRYDMTKPCANCPFRTGQGAIRFANRERAEEIEESAYRHGFPLPHHGGTRRRRRAGRVPIR